MHTACKHQLINIRFPSSKHGNPEVAVRTSVSTQTRSRSTELTPHGFSSVLAHLPDEEACLQLPDRCFWDTDITWEVKEAT